MQHGSLRAPVRVFMAAVLLCLSFLAAPKAAAAQLQNVNGITLLSFDSQQIVSIGNQTSGRCSWYALRYARTILDAYPQVQWDFHHENTRFTQALTIFSTAKEEL